MTDIFSVPASGLVLHAQVDRGPPGAPWLLFSNSLVTDLSIWDRQVEAFAGRYNILRYDQRGHGRTGVPALAPTFEDLADDVVRIASAVGVERFTYIGLSMGVPTGLRLFATRPDLIERLVLCDGGAATTPERGKLWAERIAAVRRDGMGPFTAETMARWFSGPFLASPDAEQVRAVMAGTAVEGFAACATALQAYDYAAVVPGIDVPTLLIAGALDGEVPKSMRRLADAIANSVFIEIPEAGHIPNAEQPAAFNAALSEFVARS